MSVSVVIKLSSSILFEMHEYGKDYEFLLFIADFNMSMNDDSV